MYPCLEDIIFGRLEWKIWLNLKHNSLGKNLKPEINKVKVSVVDKENFENKKLWHDMLVSTSSESKLLGLVDTTKCLSH